MDPFKQLFKGFSTPPVSPGAFGAPKKPVVSPFSIPTRPAMANPSLKPIAPAPNMSTVNGPVFGGTASAMTARPATPTMAPAPSPAPARVAPVATAPQAARPTTPATPSTAPVTDARGYVTTPSGAVVDPKTGTVITPPPSSQQEASTPATPAVPQEDPSVTAAAKAYQAALGMTPEEEAINNDLSALETSARQAYRNTSDQTIPLEFITGQNRSIEERALNLQQPLKDKAALLQAKRQMALDASKFALERADKSVDARASAAKDARAEAESTRRFEMEQSGKATDRALEQKKFEQNVKQFGMEYALKARETATREREAASKAAEKAAETGSGAIAPSKALDQINLVKNSLKAAQKFAHASGRSGIRKTFEGAVVGSTDYTDLVAETNSLRTNVLTMMTDPAIKKFFGPQMSNADVQLMTSAGTTLNPELQSPARMRSELSRLEDLVARAEKAVTQGTAGASTATPAQMQLPNGKIVTRQADGTYK